MKNFTLKNYALMTLMLLASVCHASIFFVATNGSDSNPGTQSQPWLTLAHAAASATCGDTTIVESGTYAQGSSELFFNTSCTASSPILFTAQNKWEALITSTVTNTAIQVNGDYTILQNFDISDAASNSMIKIGFGGSALPVGDQIIGNRIHNWGKTTCLGGGGVLAATTNAVIAGNFVFNYGVASCNLLNGIYLQDGDGNTITNNLIGDATAGTNTGIQVNGESAGTADFPSNETITNNTIFNVTGYGVLEACWNIPPPNPHICDNNILNNNLLANNTTSCGSSVHTANHGGSTFGTHNAYANNLIFNSGSADMASGQTLTNTVTTNPLFVSYQANGSGNYQVQSTSPAINAGTSSGAPATDFNGIVRSGGIWIGAFQSTNFFMQ